MTIVRCVVLLFDSWCPQQPAQIVFLQQLASAMVKGEQTSKPCDKRFRLVGKTKVGKDGQKDQSAPVIACSEDTQDVQVEGEPMPIDASSIMSRYHAFADGKDGRAEGSCSDPDRCGRCLQGWRRGTESKL